MAKYMTKYLYQRRKAKKTLVTEKINHRENETNAIKGELKNSIRYFYWGIKRC